MLCGSVYMYLKYICQFLYMYMFMCVCERIRIQNEEMKEKWACTQSNLFSYVKFDLEFQ